MLVAIIELQTIKQIFWSVYYQYMFDCLHGSMVVAVEVACT